jgi:hypothetical protein
MYCHLGRYDSSYEIFHSKMGMGNRVGKNSGPLGHATGTGMAGICRAGFMDPPEKLSRPERVQLLRACLCCSVMA